MSRFPKLQFDKLGRSGVPGVVHVLGPNAEAIFTSPPPQCDAVAAAAEGPNNGRVVAVAHEGYITHPSDLTHGPDFWREIVSWAGHYGGGRGGSGAPVRVGCHGRDTAWLTDVLKKAHLEGSFIVVNEQDPSCNVIVWIGTTGSGNVMSKYTDIRTTEFGFLLNFVERGGGLVVSMCPWGFESVILLDCFIRDKWMCMCVCVNV